MALGMAQPLVLIMAQGEGPADEGPSGDGSGEGLATVSVARGSRIVQSLKGSHV